MTLHQESQRNVHTEHGDGVAIIKRRHQDLYRDGVRDLATASGRGRLKENLESSTWRRRHDFKATPYGMVHEVLPGVSVRGLEGSRGRWSRQVVMCRRKRSRTGRWCPMTHTQRPIIPDARGVPHM
ncbi:hypothetical protein Tco_1174282 [Tanacetum coccineum]